MQTIKKSLSNKIPFIYSKIKISNKMTCSSSAKNSLGIDKTYRNSDQNIEPSRWRKLKQSVCSVLFMVMSSSLSIGGLGLSGLSQASHAANLGMAARASDTTSPIHPAIAAKTQIAVSNYPLFLISEAVTKGAPSGHLLLDAGDIGHHGSLSPGDMRTIQDSRYVVWFGDKLETNLVNTMQKHNNTIALFDMRAFKRYPLRDVTGQDIDQTLDPHIWLDPQNAKAIARALGALYSRANPQNGDLYTQNVRDFSTQMDTAVASLQQTLVDSDVQPYWAYHDALQYIESSLNLQLAGTLTPDHHLPPKASQFRWLQQNRPNETMCIALQSDSNQGVVSKLEPVTTTTLQEDMSQNDSFVSGWLHIARSLTDCVASAK